MKPILYDKTGKTQLGVLEHCINCTVEEERNGAFTLTLTYPITDELHHQLIYDNIIIAKANDEYDNQQFRIMATERIIKGIEEAAALATLHNPAAIYGIDACKKLMAGKPMVTVFDTALSV